MERNNDHLGRWRNVVVAFRVSKGEADMINRLVEVSGMSKQDYIIARLTNREVIVEGSIRTFHGIKNQLAYVLEELKRIKKLNPEHEELIELMEVIAEILLRIEENQNLAEKRRVMKYRKLGGDWDV